MDHSAGRFVPKVHPLTRDAEPEDPLELHATVVAGDTDLMIRAVVQEYGAMGWSGEAILGLFLDPSYPMLNSVAQALGPAGIRNRIAEVFQSHGVYRFRCTVQEAPEEPDVVQIHPTADRGVLDGPDAPNLVQIQPLKVNRGPTVKGESHHAPGL